MRPSEFATLAQCEALWLRRVPEGGAMSAAAYVGKLAHAWLTETEDTESGHGGMGQDHSESHGGSDAGSGHWQAG